jgi:hypothetical protein
MLGKFVKQLFGWKEPVLPYPYRVTRVSRDLFSVQINGRTAKLAAESGERVDGKYEIVLYPSSSKQWEEDGTPIAQQDHELLLRTLEQFLSANNYRPRRA